MRRRRWGLHCMMLLAAIVDAQDTWTVEDTQIHPTEPVSHLTCYYCEDVQSNHICNRFAIDTPCPAGSTFCRTLHIMDEAGQTLVVNKRCATDTLCNSQSVGCLQEDHQKTCVSCCHESYCNEPVPTNYSNAVVDIKPTAPTQAVKSSAETLLSASRLPPLLLLCAVVLNTLGTKWLDAG